MAASAPSTPPTPSGLHDDLAHYPLDDLHWSRDNDFMPASQALLNRGPTVTTAIVFVHGWGGRAIGTWEDFPAALRDMPEAAHADGFFIEYPSKALSAAICGGELAEFVFDLLRHPANRIVNGSLPPAAVPRPVAMDYERIVLVAHSMGAIVARRALLNLDRNVLTPGERDRIRMLFFAAAHMGSELPGLVSSGLGLDWLPGATLVGSLLAVHYRSLGDLRRGSDCLRLLADDSRQARERCATHAEADAHLRPLVLHAHGDRVVSQDRFDEDFEGRPIARRNHRTICKPEGGYRRPVEALRALLRL